ncbi:MAG TPA: right-handed parallel beta-helix repeat-containing protein, partial [Chitinophagaceae bacterium]|nr:right-handed parallel beta-helix repeat-containing protein [Chitinophagaceae bacterium]
VHNLVYNATIKNLELYSNHPYAEAGISIQGGFNITVDAIHATNPGAGLAGFQFCEGCVLKNSVLDSCANQGNANWGRGVTINECVNCQILKNTFNKYQRVAIVHEANNPGAIIAGNIFNNNFNDSPRVAVVSLGSGGITLDNNRFTGFKHILYDQVKSFGKLTLLNTMVDKGTPFEYYEQQGVVTSGFLGVGDTKFHVRKTFTKTFLLPVNGTYAFDSLPKGWITGATVKVDDTTGITGFYFRRDNSYTNNSVNFFAQLRSGQTISPNIGAGFQVGAGLSASSLNYNLDKGFAVTTNANARPGKYCTVSITFLESSAGPYNKANKLAK